MQGGHRNIVTPRCKLHAEASDVLLFPTQNGWVELRQHQDAHVGLRDTDRYTSRRAPAQSSQVGSLTSWTGRGDRIWRSIAAATSDGLLSRGMARTRPRSASSLNPEVFATRTGLRNASASMTATGCDSPSL